MLPLDLDQSSIKSDGKILDYDMWLNTPLNSSMYNIYSNLNLTYSLMIFYDKFHDVSTDKFLELAYSISIFPDGKGGWKKVILEYEPLNPFSYKKQNVKLINSSEDFSDFYSSGNNYVNFKIDLESIGSPNTYSVVSGIFFKYQNFLMCPSLLKENNDYKINYIKSIYPTYPFNFRNFNIYTQYVQIPNFDIYSKDKIVSFSTIMNVPVTSNFFRIDVDQPITIGRGQSQEITGTVRVVTDTSSIVHLIDEVDDGFHFEFKPDLFFILKNLTAPVKMIISSENDVRLGLTNTSYNLKQQILPNLGNYSNINQYFLLNVISPDIFSTYVKMMRNSELTYITPFLISFPLAFLLYRRIDELSQKKNINVLSINATVITGVLIFITLGSLFTSGEESRILERLPILLTASIVIPFASSSLLYVVERKHNFGVLLMWVGFLYLIISVVIIAIVK